MASERPREALLAAERPKPIHLNWDEEALGLPCFNTGSINLVGPHLSRPTPAGSATPSGVAGDGPGESVSDVRLAMLLGAAPWDLEILDLRTNKAVPTRAVDVGSAEARAAPLATGASLGQDVGPARDYHDEAQKLGAGSALPTKKEISSYRAFDGLRRGFTPGYALRLTPAGAKALRPPSGDRWSIPYRRLARDGHVTREEVDRLSRAFYTKVFANEQPSTFRAAFVESAGTVEAAARNQSSWFYRYFGGPGPDDGQSSEQRSVAAGGGGPVEIAAGSGEDLGKVSLREGLLTRSLVPKHPDTIMTLEHALVWIGLMAEAIGESFPGEHRRALRRSLLMFVLHFLGFFPFTEAEICKIYEKAIGVSLTPAATTAASKL